MKILEVIIAVLCVLEKVQMRMSALGSHKEGLLISVFAVLVLELRALHLLGGLCIAGSKPLAVMCKI
jgi:hypothetical protein